MLVNGKKQTIKQTAGSYITIDRKCSTGDRVEVTFPISIRVIPTNDHAKVAEVAYGPIVLAAPIRTEGMTGIKPYQAPSDPYEFYGFDYHIPNNILHKSDTKGKDLTTMIHAVEWKKRTFTVEGTPITLVPFYNLHRER